MRVGESSLTKQRRYQVRRSALGLCTQCGTKAYTQERCVRCYLVRELLRREVVYPVTDKTPSRRRRALEERMEFVSWLVGRRSLVERYGTDPVSVEQARNLVSRFEFRSEAAAERAAQFVSAWEAKVSRKSRGLR